MTEVMSPIINWNSLTGDQRANIRQIYYGDDICEHVKYALDELFGLGNIDEGPMDWSGQYIIPFNTLTEAQQQKILWIYDNTWCDYVIDTFENEIFGKDIYRSHLEYIKRKN